MHHTKYKIKLEENGYSVLAGLYSDDEISEISACIENAEQEKGIRLLKQKICLRLDN